MKKLRVSPALLALCAAVLLFVGAFFLGRASALGEARITVQRAAPASDALQIDGSGEGKLCLNTATREELLALPGVGEKTADRILSYRDTYGRFSAVEQLLDVEGIGPTLLEQLRGLVTVDQTEGCARRWPQRRRSRSRTDRHRTRGRSEGYTTIPGRYLRRCRCRHNTWLRDRDRPC